MTSARFLPLLRALASAGSGRLPVALVAGGPGAGKTALTEYLTASRTWEAATGLAAASATPVHVMPGNASAAVLQAALAAKAPEHDHVWFTHWLRAFAVELGGPDTAETDPIEAMKGFGRSAHGVFVVDGLEAFRGSADDQTVQTMIHVLLLRCTDYFSYYPRRPFGLIILARPETVRWAAGAYSDQLLEQYRSFALTPDPEKASS